MKKIIVMMAGLPGKMALSIAEAIVLSKDMSLAPYGLTGQETEERLINIKGQQIELLDSSQKKQLLHYFQIDDIPDIVIDATEAGSINDNVAFYAVNRLPFVMLTTGGDMDYIRKKVCEVQDSGETYNAVVSANMAEDIVVVQAMFEYAAKTFPGAFKRFITDVEESHQEGKKDTSGTAKEIVSSLKLLGAEADIEKIKKNRTPEENSAFGVPEEHYKGHGWHTYSLIRDDKNVFLQFVHNVNGRKPYVDGTLNAVRFLHKAQETDWAGGKVFSMIDVLQGVK